MANVVQISEAQRKRSYTTAEKLIEEVRNQIFRDGRPYKDVAVVCNVSATTVRNLASGKTVWPRPTTLFPMFSALNMEMRLVKKGDPR